MNNIDLLNAVKKDIDLLPVGFRFLQKITPDKLVTSSEIEIDFYKARRYPVFTHYKPISKIINFPGENIQEYESD
jgi:hypothetical protein